MLTTHYKRIVRASAIYDLLVTAPFATPWSFALVFQTLSLVAPIPAFQPEHVLFANLLGSIVVVWSFLRIYEPLPIYGLFDSAGRALFFTWQVYYLVIYQITPVAWLFAVFEFTFFIAQAYGFWLLRKVESNSTSPCRIVNFYRAHEMA